MQKRVAKRKVGLLNAPGHMRDHIPSSDRAFHSLLEAAPSGSFEAVLGSSWGVILAVSEAPGASFGTRI